MSSSRFLKAGVVVGLVLVLCAGVFPVYGQDAGPEDASYRIEEVEYSITGLTLRPFLEEYLGIQRGTVFPNRAALENYVEGLQRTIVNNRVFMESSRVEYSVLGDQDPRPVRLFVSVVNSGSSLVVPFPKYDSEDGLSLAIRYKDFNFLGTLEPVSLNLDYYFASKEIDLATYFTVYMNALRSRWAFSVAGDLLYEPGSTVKPNGSASLSSTYRFDAAGLKWQISPLLYYLYERDYLEHTFTTGASAGFGFHAGLDWNVSASTYFNDEYVNSHYPYITNGLGLSSSIRLANVPYFGALKFNPAFGIFGTYGIERGRYTDAGWSTSASLSIGRVDLVGNMRKGASFSTDIYYAYHPVAPLATDEFDLTASVQASAFYPFSPLIGVDFRLTGYWFGTWTYLGEQSSFEWSTYIRGKKPDMYGDLGLIANLQFPFNFAQGRFFVSDRYTAEVHIIPFVDAGYIRPDPTRELFRPDDLVLTTGVDAVVFPLYARAFTYRLSVGYDLMDFFTTNELKLSGVEVWLGLGLHF